MQSHPALGREADQKERSSETPILDRAPVWVARRSYFSFKSFVENRRQKGVEFGCGFGLQALEPVHLGLQGVQFGDDAALFGKWRHRNNEGFYVSATNPDVSRSGFPDLFDL